MDIRYQHPEFLIALITLPLIGFLFWNVIRWKRSTLVKIGDTRLVSELIRGHSPGNYLIKFIFSAVALTAIIIAIVNPQRQGSMDKVERKGVDVMIALDVSNSMLAQDIRPNRLEKAKQIMNRLMTRLENDRVGLVLFAGRAYMQMPLTTDHAAARMYIQNANPDIVPTQGTMISEALRLSVSAFNSKERKYKSIVLITDGEDHDPTSMELAQQLSSNGVMINTIGIGSSLGTPIPDPSTGQYRQDDQGNTVLSKLNESQLQQIAAVTRGVYVNAGNSADPAEAVMQRLSTIQETAMEDSAFRDYLHYFPWFIGIAIALLIAESFFPERKFRIT